MTEFVRENRISDGPRGPRRICFRRAAPEQSGRPSSPIVCGPGLHRSLAGPVSRCPSARRLAILRMRSLVAIVLGLLAPLLAYAAEKPLPPLHDGIVVAGPADFHSDGELRIEGHVTLRNLTLHLHGPIRVAAGATFDLEKVDLIVSDPPGAPNGTSGLRCEGAAHVILRNSKMAPAGSAHPMWLLRGQLEVENFQTKNSEFHLDHVQAKLDRLRIFELEISRASQVTAHDLDLVFLSTHSGDDDRLQFADIPADKPFSATLKLGSGASAELHNTSAQLFLVYMHGHSQLALNRMGRVQLAIFPDCKGALTLPHGMVGTAAQPAIFPAPGASNCPFHISMSEVNLDTWDVYAGGEADLTFTHSVVDELTANGNAKITVRDSELYADWLALAGDAQLRVEKSTVGALRLVAERPDLATTQVRLGGRSQAFFSQVRFDCGIFAADQARVEIDHAETPPAYIQRSGSAVVRTSATPAAK